MSRFVEGADRGQSTLFPECLEDWIGEDNPVRVNIAKIFDALIRSTIKQVKRSPARSLALFHLNPGEMASVSETKLFTF